MADAIIRELTIHIELDYFVDWCGSADQLVDEGLVPKSLVWPAGRDKVRWQDERLKYCLHRTRPADHPGRVLAAEWDSIDWWQLRVELVGSDYDLRRRRALERRTAALAKDLEELTPAGRMRAERLRDAWMAAAADENYQRMISGLGVCKRPPKRTRVQP